MCQTTSTVINRFKRCVQSYVPQAVWERDVPPLRAMEETLHGTIWNIMSLLLTTEGRGEVQDSDQALERGQSLWRNG